MKPFFVLDEGNFYAGAAEIEKEKIVLVDGVNDAGKTERGFFSPANHGHGDAGLFQNEPKEIGAVLRVSDGGGGNGPDARDGEDFGGVRVHGQAI